MLLAALIQIVDLLINVLVTLIVVQFVIGLLFAFNVVSARGGFLSTIYTSIDALLAPVLQPIRRRLPSTGSIDFSPLVLIIGLQILRILLGALVQAAVVA